MEFSCQSHRSICSFKDTKGQFLRNTVDQWSEIIIRVRTALQHLAISLMDVSITGEN